MAQVAHLQLVTPAPRAPLSILADTFQPALEKFNQLTRDMRNAGICVAGTDFPDNCIVIEEEDVAEFSRRFGHEIRSTRSKSLHGSRLARRTVTIRGIDVVWFSVLLEQQS